MNADVWRKTTRYLIEQLQYTGAESVGSSSNKVRLNFNHPVKELVWVVQPDCHVDYCSSLVGGNVLFKALGSQPFNYTDAVDALPNSIKAFGGPSAVGALGSAGAGGDAFITNQLFETAGAEDLNVDGVADAVTGAFDGTWAGTGGGAVSGVSDAGTFVLAESSLDMHCWGENPVVTAKLQLN